MLFDNPLTTPPTNPRQRYAPVSLAWREEYADAARRNLTTLAVVEWAGAGTVAK